MHLLNRSITIGSLRIPLPVFAWFFLAILAAIAEISRGQEAINNYYIFKGVFEHTLAQKHLYLQYPGEYLDSNHYGPLFSILIAPFALLPVWLGCFLWCLANAWVLFYAIQQLQLSKKQELLILLIGLVEMMTAIHNVQFNPMLTGWILLSFVLVEKQKDGWAALFIMAGFFIKLYGIVGVAFFLFSKHKLRFLFFLVLWGVVLFCLPMLLSSPEFIMQSYKDWLQSLVQKNAENVNLADENLMQDISVMGMIRRMGHVQVKNYFVIGPAALFYALPFLRISQYRYAAFRISYLCLLLIGAVIFSSSAESSTFVLAVTGIALWYVIQEEPRKKWANALLLFVILLTSLSATDLFPPYVRRNIILPYSLKALPCFTAWCVIVYQLLRKDFAGTNISAGTATQTQELQK